jgi:GABA(A) receptor-associated protein
MVNKKFQSRYKETHSFEQRKAEADKVRDRHPDRLPVICEKVDKSNITDLDKNKFLVPSDLSVGQFVLVVRKRVMLEPEKAIFLFIGESVPPNAALMSDLYNKHKDEDGFLYVKYAGESSFGTTQ